MAKDYKTYNIPQDSQPAMASEALAACTSQPAQGHIVLTIPQGVDADSVREKVNGYYDTLLKEVLRQQEFYFHYQKWMEETGPLSSPRAIASNTHLRAIVKMGKSIVPLIVEKMKQDHSLIYLALEQIYQERMLAPKPLADTNTMYAWNPEENRRLWIERLS